MGYNLVQVSMRDEPSFSIDIYEKDRECPICGTKPYKGMGGNCSVAKMTADMRHHQFNEETPDIIEVVWESCGCVYCVFDNGAKIPFGMHPEEIGKILREKTKEYVETLKS